MRMGIKAELPDGAELRFFDGQSNQGSGYPVIGPTDFVPKNGTPAMLGASAAEPESAEAGGALSGLAFSLKDATAEILWSPVVKGDTIGVEISLPTADALSAFSLSIEKISHIDGLIDVTIEPRRLNCLNHIDVQCAQGRLPETQADAAASILFEDEEGTFLCSGTLLNDTLDDTFIPYFLTAHHCVPSATVAHTVESWWFYRRATCGLVEIDERFEVTYGGADLLATSHPQDSSLLRLRGRLPAGVSYAGWNADPVLHPAVVHGLHHPRGDEMKYSAGRTLGQSDVQVRGLGTLVNAVFVRWLDPVWSLDLPFVTAASNLDQQGFVRIANHSGRAGTVRIHAVDDTGEYRGPIELSLDAHQAAHFNSDDLKSGNPSKGLSAGVGDGAGNWRLELTARFPIDARAYVRTTDGFLASIHKVAAEAAAEAETAQGMAVRYHVPIFNPGDNDIQQSRLRVINTGVEAAEIEISGQDDLGGIAAERQGAPDSRGRRRAHADRAGARGRRRRHPRLFRRRHRQVATDRLRRPAAPGHEPDAERDRASHQSVAVMPAEGAVVRERSFAIAVPLQRNANEARLTGPRCHRSGHTPRAEQSAIVPAAGWH